MYHNIKLILGNTIHKFYHLQSTQEVEVYWPVMGVKVCYSSQWWIKGSVLSHHRSNCYLLTLCMYSCMYQKGAWIGTFLPVHSNSQIQIYTQMESIKYNLPLLVSNPSLFFYKKYSGGFRGAPPHGPKFSQCHAVFRKI